MLSKIFAFFVGGWEGTAVAMVIAALLSAGGTWYLTSFGYRLTIANMQRDQTSAQLIAANQALQQFTADAGTIHNAAASFGTVSAALTDQLTTISKGFLRDTKAHPLPADCKPDAERLRALIAATAATNSAAGLRPSTAVSGHP